MNSLVQTNIKCLNKEWDNVVKNFGYHRYFHAYVFQCFMSIIRLSYRVVMAFYRHYLILYWLSLMSTIWLHIIKKSHGWYIINIILMKQTEACRRGVSIPSSTPRGQGPVHSPDISQGGCQCKKSHYNLREVRKKVYASCFNLTIYSETLVWLLSQTSG